MWRVRGDVQYLWVERGETPQTGNKIISTLELEL